MARSLHLSFICIPQSTRALDQGGVEPRQAVSPKALRPWTIPLRYSVGWDHSVVVLCFSGCVSGLLAGGSLGSVAGLALVLLVLCWLLVIQDLNLMFRLTVSPAKRALPKFMKMVSFGSSHLL